MTVTLLEVVTTPIDDDFDDDLVHTICDECDRALCDGGVCTGVDHDVSPDDLLCVVCEDLEAALLEDDCPHCGHPPPT